jgi:IclR family KDG regulon transcriptional repressor
MRQPSASVPALERGIRILEMLGQQRLTAAQIQSRMRVHRASVYRILTALQQARLVSQDPASGAYGLGPELITLGFRARISSPLVLAAKPVLQRISAATHSMSELTVRAGGWMLLVLDTWQSEDTPVRINSRAGMLLEMHHENAHGLCHLAHASGRRVQSYIALSQTASGRRTLVLPRPCDDSLLDQCRQWRKLGYAWRSRTRHLENGRVATPVFNRKGEMIATLGVACDSRRLTPMRAAQWGGVLMVAARELEVAMNGG